MFRIYTRFCGYEKHRKVQLFVTSATIVGGVIAIFKPEYGHASVLAGVVTNIIWVWE